MDKKGFVLIFSIIFLLCISICIQYMFTNKYKKLKEYRNKTYQVYQELDVDLIITNYIKDLDEPKKDFLNGITYKENNNIYTLYRNDKTIYTIKHSFNSLYHKDMIWIKGNGIEGYYEVAFNKSKKVIIHKEYSINK